MSKIPYFSASIGITTFLNLFQIKRKLSNNQIQKHAENCLVRKSYVIFSDGGAKSTNYSKKKKKNIPR